MKLEDDWRGNSLLAVPSKRYFLPMIYQMANMSFFLNFITFIKSENGFTSHNLIYKSQLPAQRKLVSYIKNWKELKLVSQRSFLNTKVF